MSDIFYCAIGRAAWVRHIRNGQELPNIARDDHYDFNYQVIKNIIKININVGMINVECWEHYIHIRY